MKVLHAYLWKEWRDQRATLGWLALILSALAGVDAIFLSRNVASDPLLVASALAISLLAFLLTVGSDLLPGEVARGRIGFLERMPAGLSTIFRAKLVFFVLAGAGVVLYGLLLALAVSLLREGTLPTDYLIPFLVLVVPIAIWTFPVSAWVPRSTLALPVTGVALAVLAWPLWFALGGVPWYAPTHWELAAYLALCLAGAPLSAWVSFAWGYRFGRGPGHAALRGIAVAAIVLAPGWCWTGLRIHTFRSLDPNAVDFRIWGCYVGEGGRYAFATASLSPRRMPDGRSQEMPFHALVLDLRTGAWSSPGLGRWFPWRSSPREFSGLTTRPHSHVLLWDPAGKETCYDARRAEPLSAAPTSVSRYGMPRAQELGLKEGSYLVTRAGLGFRVGSRQKEGRGLYDPFRSRFFAQSDLFPDGAPWGWIDVRIRPGRWVFRDRPSRSWRLLDPETGEQEQIPGLADGYMIGALSADGRVFLGGDEGVHLLDPETGRRTPVRFADGWTDPVGVIRRAGTPLPSDPVVLWIWGTDWSGIARFDPETSTLHRASGSTGEVQLLACMDDDTVLILEDHRRIVRLRFGGEDREVLFP